MTWLVLFSILAFGSLFYLFIRFLSLHYICLHPLNATDSFIIEACFSHCACGQSFPYADFIVCSVDPHFHWLFLLPCLFFFRKTNKCKSESCICDNFKKHNEALYRRRKKWMKPNKLLILRLDVNVCCECLMSFIAPWPKTVPSMHYGYNW